MELRIENGTLLGVNDCDLHVVLPEGIEKIGYSAFSGCSELVSIIVPDSVTIIEGRAFENCEKLAQVKLPVNLKKLGFCSFAGCSSLRKIELPDQVKSIEENMFDGCELLEEVKLPKEAVVLQMDVFRGCRSLKKVELPTYLFQLDTGDFYGCENLTSISWPPRMKIEYSKRFFDDKTMESLLKHHCLSLKHIYDREWRKLACIIQMRRVMEGAYDAQEPPKEFRKYPNHIRQNHQVFYPELMNDMDVLEYFCKEEIIPAEDIPELINRASSEKKTHVSARLLEYQNHLGGALEDSFEEELADFLSLDF